MSAFCLIAMRYGRCDAVSYVMPNWSLSSVMGNILNMENSLFILIICFSFTRCG